MTIFEKLLTELCLEGVEYKKLSDIATVARGVRVVRDQLAETGEIPVYQNSLKPLGYHDKANVKANTAFVIGAGAAGEIGYSKVDFWAADDCYYCDCPKGLNSRYLYFILMKNQPLLFSRVRKASIPRLSRTFIENLVIPVPPLEVQVEIVRILDNFTELTARKKQYEYYREQILSEIKNAKMCELQEIVAEDCSISYGIVQTGDDVEDGVPVVRPVDLTCKIVSLNGLKKVSSSISDSYKRTVLKGGDLLVCVCGTTGVISIAAEELNGCNVSRGIVPLTFKDDICKDYVYYQLIGNAIQETIQAKTKGTALKQINMEDLRHILIPIPPIEEQERIVSILDRFDKLCNDISEGLPAEIEARCKQYEYYRDKLLTFKEVKP